GLTHPRQLSLEEAGRHLDGLQPWPEHGTGADIAGTAVFLASDDARFVNGEAIVVDGALTAVGPDVWQRFGIPREASMQKSRINKGTTGEASTVRRLTE
ncbi:MAG: SDR family oxidoreductase, partial [Gammaproteobacteria bacterium]